MNYKKILLPFVLLFIFVISGCSASKDDVSHQNIKIEEEQFLNNEIEKSENNNFDELQPEKTLEDVKIDERADNKYYCSIHGYEYDLDCEECPPPRITEGVDIDGPGGMNPNWPTESDNPNRWPKNMGDLDTDDQDLEIERENILKN